MKEPLLLVHKFGALILRYVEEMGSMVILFFSALRWMFVPPIGLKNIFKQMEFIGVKSIFIVVLTGIFTGMVMALQTYHGARMFSAESMVGPTVALAVTRELGPVLTALIVTARAGSAIAAELGTMRVTEQIDALYVMATDPTKYLIVPRIIACVFMFPLLTAISDYMGILGSYLVGVQMLGMNDGVFIDNIIKYVKLADIYNGLFKATCFGLLMAVISCYNGFNTHGGAEGVGRATTEAVVISSVTIFVSDYLLTALMF